MEWIRGIKNKPIEFIKKMGEHIVTIYPSIIPEAVDNAFTPQGDVTKAEWSL